MRRQQHRHESNMFASTRIAVALCAAIAMVLGAMSVGANRRETHTLLDTPAAAAGTPLTNRESASPAKSSSESDDELPLGDSYSAQQQLAVKPQVVRPALLVNPRVPQADISLGPIKTLINEEKLHIELDASIPALAPLVPPVPVDTPAVTIDVPADPIGNVVDPLQHGLQSGEAGETNTPPASQDQQLLP